MCTICMPLVAPHTDETIKTECFASKLHSIIGQLEYSYKIRRWDGLGILFKTHFYVPEKYPLTKVDFHKREDEGHVFKVSIQYVRTNIMYSLNLN